MKSGSQLKMNENLKRLTESPVTMKVLEKMLEYARPDGSDVFVSNARIARELRPPCTIRSVQRAKRILEAEGLLRRVGTYSNRNGKGLVHAADMRLYFQVLEAIR